MIQPRATQKVVLEAGPEIAAFSVVAATALSIAAAVTAGITILPILQKAAALLILPQSQRIYLGHLLRTSAAAAAGKYNSQNL